MFSERKSILQNLNFTKYQHVYHKERQTHTHTQKHAHDIAALITMRNKGHTDVCDSLILFVL